MKQFLVILDISNFKMWSFYYHYYINRNQWLYHKFKETSSQKSVFKQNIEERFLRWKQEQINVRFKLMPLLTENNFQTPLPSLLFGNPPPPYLLIYRLSVEPPLLLIPFLLYGTGGYCGQNLKCKRRLLGFCKLDNIKSDTMPKTIKDILIKFHLKLDK